MIAFYNIPLFVILQLDYSYESTVALLLEKLSIEQFVPKELGELFMAVIAAVLLDSKSNEDITWSLAKSLLNPIFGIYYSLENFFLRCSSMCLLD